MTVASKPRMVALPFTAEDDIIRKRIACWWWGRHDEEAAFAIGMADLVAHDPVAKHLYLFHCAGDMAGPEAVKNLAAWCAGMAAECGMAVNRRKRQKVASYEPRWGRQAGRDGACLAMWGNDIRDLLPGVNKRAARYGCSSDAYLVVRDYVQVEACDLIDGFARDVECAMTGKFDPDFRGRWEQATGRTWR